MANLNQLAFRWIFSFSHRSPVADGVGIFLAQYLPYLLAAGFLVLVASQSGVRRRLLLFIEGVLAVILSRGILTELIRFFYSHPRPFETFGFAPLVQESGSSFPSGHAAFFFALAMVIYYSNRTWGIWYFVIAAINSVSRIYVGVHWPLDIVGGALLGVLCGTLIHALLKPSLEKLARSPTAT